MTQGRALSSSQIARTALIVLVGFLASGILGMVRTAAFSAVFGTSAELDAFYAAQRIPEMLFTLVAGGALGSSFIPVFSRYLTADDQAGAWRLASAVMTLSTLAAALLATLLALFAGHIVPALLVPGAAPEQQALTTSLTRLMLVTTVIFSISGLLMGILNAHQLFLLPALALSMNNIGLIIGALIFAQLGGGPPNVYGLAWGAVLGAALHLLIQLPGLPRVRARIRPLLDWRIQGVREVLSLMGPRVLGLAVVQINFAVNVAFASSMVEGSLVALNHAWFLMFFALGVIAQSMGTAVFPSLSALAAAKDMDGYRERLAGAMRSVLFLSFPASVGLILLGKPVIGAIFQRGEFSAESTDATAWALAFFALGIAGHALLEVLSRAFYALADTWIPVRIGILAMGSNIALSLIFIQFVGDADSLERGPFAGLALANSLTTLLEGAGLWWLLRRRIGGLYDRAVIDMALRSLVAALGMGAVVWLVSQALRDSQQIVIMGAGILTGAVAYFVLALALGIAEARSVPRMILRRRQPRGA